LAKIEVSFLLWRLTQPRQTGSSPRYSTDPGISPTRDSIEDENEDEGRGREENHDGRHGGHWCIVVFVYTFIFMNPVGIHFGYWTQYWGTEPIEFVEKAKKCGFDILEINAPKVTRMSDAERDALKGAAADAGLELTYSIGMTADMDMTSEDAATRKKGVAFLQDVAQAMKYMGGTVLAGINYSSWPRKPGPDEDKQVLTDRAVEGVREAIKAAEDCGVLFCLEVVNRFEHFIMNTAAEGIAFAKRVDSPNCKLLLDTFHINIEEDSIRGAIVETGPLLGHFHLGEPNRRPPGRGRMPWPEIFGALREINYQGAVVMEPFLVPGGEVGRDISVFRDLLGNDDRDEEAARSVQFVREAMGRV
jgi:D-psicose/D-tagatose/L-ribulose 3-epimerase